MHLSFSVAAHTREVQVKLESLFLPLSSLALCIAGHYGVHANVLALVFALRFSLNENKRGSYNHFFCGKRGFMCLVGLVKNFRFASAFHIWCAI